MMLDKRYHAPDGLMTLLRVEDSKGTGAYGAGMVPSSCYGDAHPSPTEDRGFKSYAKAVRQDECECWEAVNRLLTDIFTYRSNGPLLFGFASVAAYHAWFDDDARYTLRMAGGRVVVYHAPPECAFIGAAQAVFDRRHATKRAELDPITLLRYGAMPRAK